jgi:hypothetical protein
LSKESFYLDQKQTQWYEQFQQLSGEEGVLYTSMILYLHFEINQLLLLKVMIMKALDTLLIKIHYK